MKIIGIIPARSGSKRIPNKNKKLLAGKPLIQYAINAALESKYLDKIVVSSDDEEILTIAHQEPSITAMKRPSEISQDNSLAIQYVHHVLLTVKEDFDIVVIIQASSPFTKGFDIDATIKLLLDSNDASSAASVVKLDHALQPSKIKTIENNILKNYFHSEQDTMTAESLPTLYIRNGSVYASKIKTIHNNKIIAEPCLAYIMPRERSIDINDPIDWEFAEFIMSKNGF